MNEMDGLSFAELREANVRRCVGSFKHHLADWSTLEWLGALCGEAGEAANVAKKLKRIDTDVAVSVNKAGETRDALRAKLGAELADTVIYACLAAAREEIDLGAAVRAKFDETSERVGSDVRLPEPTAELATLRATVERVEREGEEWRRLAVEAMAQLRVTVESQINPPASEVSHGS